MLPYCSRRPAQRVAVQAVRDRLFVQRFRSLLLAGGVVATGQLVGDERVVGVLRGERDKVLGHRLHVGAILELLTAFDGSLDAGRRYVGHPPIVPALRTGFGCRWPRVVRNRDPAVLMFVIPAVLAVLTAATVLAALLWSAGWWVAVVVVGSLLLLALYDLVQRRHSILRNYPVLGHMRFLLEKIRPEIQQYFIERNYDGRPYDRDTRSVIYERAKGIHGEKAYGTELDVNEVGYEFVLHSSAPLEPAKEQPRVRVGGPDCTKPYDMALLNVSAMSFGALSANAIRALNAGAASGGFAHDTGEGGLTDYHLEHGGDLIWEIGSGYFGARTKDGDFDPDMFRDKASHDAVKCVSLKLSQGAKPGIGGVLPGGQGDRRDRQGAQRAAGREVRESGVRTRCSRRRANSCSSSRGCVSSPTGSRPASSCASATGTSCSRSARRWWTSRSRRTSSSWTGPRAGREPRRSSTRTTSARR